MGTFAILAVNVFLFFVGIFARKIFISKAQDALEVEIERVVTDELVAKDDVVLENYSEQFRENISKHSQYINKRMSFGTIFQESLPFSSVMLDKNLKVEWANKRFLDEWAVNEEDMISYDLSWDYLSKLTNIGGNDPVLDALKNQIAGIYQIQLKINPQSQVHPYEMFVSPLKNEGETKIMLFFYPLSSLQETIQDQAMSILNPINKTLALIEEDRFYENEFEQLEKEFEIGAISHMLEKFKLFISSFRARENRLVDEIEVLNTKIQTTKVLFEKINANNDNLKENNTVQMKSLKKFKSSAIGLSTLTNELTQRAGETHNLITKLNSGIKEVREDFDQAKNRINDFSGVLPKLNDIKEKIKFQKNHVSTLRMKLNSDFKTLESNYSDHNLRKVIQNFSDFNSESITLEKNIIQLEILISKSQMLLHSQKMKADEFDSEMINKALEDYNLFIRELDDIGVQVDSLEGYIVESLSELYSSVTESASLQSTLDSHILSNPDTHLN
jgi:hypothetical protein